MQSFFKADQVASSLAFLCIEYIYLIKRHLRSLELNTKHYQSFEKKEKAFASTLSAIFSCMVDRLLDCCYKMGAPDKQKTINCLVDILNKAKSLNNELSIMQKPDVPLELYRFLRIFDQDGLASIDNTKIQFVLYSDPSSKALYTYNNGPLHDFAGEHGLPALDNAELEKMKSQYHIVVRREDIELPLLWPLLAHEVGHQVMDHKLFDKHNDITKSFANFLKGSQPANVTHQFLPDFLRLLEQIPEYQNNQSDFLAADILRKWLTECWCDIYGFFTTGPAFIFAQRNNFLTQGLATNDVGTCSHPPQFLRLLLLQSVAQDRLSDFFYEGDDTTERQRYDAVNAPVANLLLHQDEEMQTAIYETAQWFKEFFSDHFKMESEDNGELHELIIKMKKQLESFTFGGLKHLTDRLDKDYPIPSLRSVPSSLEERETGVHEIMMAAWYSHDNRLHAEVISSFSNHLEGMRKMDAHSRWEFFCNEIFPVFERFNQSILRSLQVSEWVALLKPSNDDGGGSGRLTIEQIGTAGDGGVAVPSQRSLIVDKQIRKMLIDDTLKIIPLISIKDQLGSTSLDIRLGTTFQTYQPNQNGVVDFTDKESRNCIHLNSTLVDLDFKNGIVIAPGQFVLAHTMEYIGLSENIAAQLEGRSSFARLGIQVHMTASFIDPGFHGSVTFEIFNAGPNPIRLFPGYRIGQLRFFMCEPPEKTYDKKKNAKYKGMLGHSSSLLVNDYEVACLDGSKLKK